MKFKLILVYLLIAPFLFSTDTLRLVLNSGEILIGESKSHTSDDHFLIRSDMLGEISLPKEKVKSYTVFKNEAIEASSNPSKATVESKQTSEKQSGSLLTKIKEVESESKSVSESKSKSEGISKLYSKVQSLSTPKSWGGNLRIGMNLSFGDREYTHTYLRGNLKIQEKDSPHLFQLSGEYNYRETEQNNGSQYISEDRYNLNFTYRWFFSETWFFQNVSSYRTDKLKGINSELQNVLGLGYRKKFYDTLELLIGSGIGFQDRSIVGLSGETSSIVSVFQELNWKPVERIKLKQTLSFSQNPNDLDTYNYEFILGFNYRLTDLLGFEMRYLMDFDNGITENVKEDSRFQNALIFYF